MSKRFGRINRALREGPSEINVQALRKRIGLTQVEFAAKFGIGLGTLRHWERGDRKPKGAALVLLRVIEKNDRAVLRALG